MALSCSRSHGSEEDDSTNGEDIPYLDTAQAIGDTLVGTQDTVTAEADFNDAQYAGGILPVISEEVPSYADRLAADGGEGFIVVDKASMRVILYDGYGFEKRVYDMACARNYGNKMKKADSRTPEGYFKVVGVYDSTDWLFTDDNGRQSKKKGQFGPRFIRINTPQIGIHGTCSPWSIGHRVSHGCIRITNENIMELSELVHAGMPVIILPGKRDRKVNREEGRDTPYFPTASKYAVSESEKKNLENIKVKEDTVEKKENTTLADSVAGPATHTPEVVPIDTAASVPKVEETVYF